MSYTDHLCTLPLERLKEIIRRRAFQIRSVPRVSTKRDLCTWLAQTLSDAYAVRRAFEETDILQARLLAILIAHGGEMSREAMAQKLGEEARERLDEAADGLESLGLAIRRPDGASGDSWRLWTPDAVRRNVPLPLPVRHKLQPTLERYEGPALSHITNYLGIGTPGLTNKQSRSNAIARKLLDPDGLQSVLDSRSDEARSILEFVVRRGGVTNLHELGLRLDTRRRNQLYSYDWSYRWHTASPRNAVEELLSAGLLVMEGSVGFHYGAILIAGDLLERMTGQNLLSGDIPIMPPWEAVTPDRQATRTHDSLCRDLAYLLGYLSRNPTGRTGKGIIHRTALKNTTKALSYPGAEYAAFVYAVGRGAGLIDTVERDESYGITPEGEAWLKLGRDEQLHTLYDAWRGQKLWVETAPDLLIDETVYINMEDVHSVRATVIDLLAAFSREHSSELLTRRSLSERARYRRWAQFPPDPETPVASANEQDEDELDNDGPITGGELVNRVSTALYWLGLLEGAANTSESIASVRLTPLGRSLLLGEPRREEGAEVESFVVQPNLEVYAPPNLTARLYFGLFRIADPKGSGMLALSRDTLRKAMDRDMTAAEILEFLRSHSSTGLPQNVEYMVREVGGKHGHIRVGSAGLYLVVDDPILLKELAAQSKLSIRIRKQLADTVALVTGDSVDAVLKQLRLAGYLPVADREEHPRAQRRASHRRPISSPAEESAASVLAAIDWNRLAKEAPAPAVESNGAVTAPKAIRQIVEQSLSERIRMEYAPVPNPQPGEIISVEPIGLAGSLLRVYVPKRGHLGILNMGAIRWARLTEEPFVPHAEPANLSPVGE